MPWPELTMIGLGSPVSSTNLCRANKPFSHSRYGLPSPQSISTKNERINIHSLALRCSPSNVPNAKNVFQLFLSNSSTSFISPSMSSAHLGLMFPSLIPSTHMLPCVGNTFSKNCLVIIAETKRARSSRASTIKNYLIGRPIMSSV